MFRWFVGLSLSCCLLLVAVAILGYTTPPFPRETFIYRHLVPALAAVLTACLLHSMVIFYFIGTSRPIREAARKVEDGAERVSQSNALQRQAILWAGAGIVSIITVAGFGGAADMLVIPYHWHGWAAAAGIGVTVVALYRETLAVAGNLQLISELNEKLEAAAPSEPET